LRESKLIGIAAILAVVVWVMYRWGPETPFFIAHRAFTLILFAVLLGAIVVMIAFIDYRELDLRIRWSSIFFRRPGGPYPFPKKGARRTLATPWLHNMLLQFIEWKREAEIRFREAYVALRNIHPHFVADDFTEVDEEEPSLKGVRTEYEEAKKSARDHERGLRRFLAWLRDAESLPPDFVDADSFWERHYGVSEMPSGTNHHPEAA